MWKFLLYIIYYFNEIYVSIIFYLTGQKYTSIARILVAVFYQCFCIESKTYKLINCYYFFYHRIFFSVVLLRNRITDNKKWHFIRYIIMTSRFDFFETKIKKKKKKKKKQV